MTKRLIYSFVFLFFMNGCTDHSKSNIPDVSGIKNTYKIIRFDKEIKSLSYSELVEKYPAFCNIFFTNVLPISQEKDTEIALQNIVEEEQYKYLLDTCQLVFGDLTKVLEDIDQSFRFLKYYIPEIDIPDIYSFVSGFAYQRFLFTDSNNENAVGIGLDMFLGESFPYKSIAPENPSFSSYLTRTFNKEHIAKKIIDLLLEDYLPHFKKTRLLDQMLRNGKKLYLLDKILPSTSDTIIMEYSEEQWQWINKNELEIWAYFLKEKLFYESNSQKINKYINASPHSPGMPPMAPGRTANYMGWQIVKSYIKRFPNTTIKELIEMNDAQELLRLARYKPPKN